MRFDKIFRRKNPGRIYLGMLKCFDGSAPVVREGRVLCYSFFNVRTKKCLSQQTCIVAADRQSANPTLAAMLAHIAYRALSDIEKGPATSCQVWNGFVYHPEAGVTATFNNPLEKVEKIPDPDFSEFEAIIRKRVPAPND